MDKPAAKKPAPTKKPVKVVYAKIINNDPKYMIQLIDGTGHYTGKYIKTNSNWKVFGEKTLKVMKCYKLGSEKQYAPAKFFSVVK